jgi:hypothetical protein
MRELRAAKWKLAAMIGVTVALTACGDNDSAPLLDDPDKRVTISSHGANAVSAWNEIAVDTVAVAAVAAGQTPAERSPQQAIDVATVHLAMYDAAMAVAGTHKPYAVTPSVSGRGMGAAALQAAIIEAAYRTLKGLYPSRGDKYEAAYAASIGAMPESAEKIAGAAIGREVATGMLALRANDGRETALAAYVPGTAPGQFRGTNPINRIAPHVRPFVTSSHSQFRPPAPYAVDSAAYAADVNEVKRMAASGSAQRSELQTEIARFQTENPGTYWPRNLRIFATANESLADNARLMAMLWTAYADAAGACFETKYHYNFWRPTSAIRLADTDGNAATDPDPAWTPFVATPNHPEYPAAHGCVTGSLMHAVRRFYGTDNVAFDFSSTVTGTTRRFARTTDLIAEMQDGRVWGGMHYRASTVVGTTLGRDVVEWMLEKQFRPAD